MTGRKELVGAYLRIAFEGPLEGQAICALLALRLWSSDGPDAVKQFLETILADTPPDIRATVEAAAREQDH